MNKASTAAQPQIKSYDPIWEQVRREAEETSANEPVLASVIYATILSEPTLEDAVCHTVAHRLQPSVDAGLLHKTFREVLADEPSLGDIFRADIMAVAKRDPACRRMIAEMCDQSLVQQSWFRLAAGTGLCLAHRADARTGL